MPAAIVPMKATLVDKPPRGEEWLFEIKWDGVRAIAFIDHEQVRLHSRTGNSCEKQYPELSVIHHSLAAEQAILDTEIAVLDEKGVSRFAMIQPRIAKTDPNSIAHLARSRPVTMFAFDLLYLDGYDLRQVDLSERQRLLEQVLTPSSVLRISDAFSGRGRAAAGSRARERPRRYRGQARLELLRIAPQPRVAEDQGESAAGVHHLRLHRPGERDHFGALVLGVYEQGKLVWVGNVGTGFDQKTLAQVRAPPGAAGHSEAAVRGESQDSR